MVSNSNLTMGGLFEGIGGFPLAGTWAGIKPIWSNEIDPWCCKVLRKNFSHEIIEKDIRLISSNTGRERQDKHEKQTTGIEQRSKERVYVPKVDILTGGFPCQPFSHAGKRKGKDDNRYLWPEYLRLIRELQPTWVIAENVAGLISMENGKTLEGIFLDLENENYTPEIYNIPACGVGAWHKRERIWIVAHSSNGSNRTNRGPEGKEKSIQSKYREAGRTRKFSRAGSYENVSNSNNERLQGSEKEGNFAEGRKNGDQFTARRNRAGRSIWEVEPNVGRVANGIPRELDRYLKKKPDKGICVKQRVIAMANVNGETFFGENWVQHQQVRCPRIHMETGQGYHLCKDVCGQEGHAEIDLIKQVGGDLKGSDVYMAGHTYCCESCKLALKKANAGKVIFTVSSRVDRLKGLGNAIVPQVAYEIFKAIVEYENQ